MLMGRLLSIGLPPVQLCWLFDLMGCLLDPLGLFLGLFAALKRYHFFETL